MSYVGIDKVIIQSAQNTMRYSVAADASAAAADCLCALWAEHLRVCQIYHVSLCLWLCVCVAQPFNSICAVDRKFNKYLS